MRMTKELGAGENPDFTVAWMERARRRIGPGIQTEVCRYEGTIETGHGFTSMPRAASSCSVGFSNERSMRGRDTIHDPA